MPSDALSVLLAAAPPLTVLVMMTVLRMGGAKAGPVGWLVALLIALLRFGAGGDLLLYAHLRALVLTLDVVLIVWTALALYMVVRAAGALDVIAAWFGSLTGDPVLRVLLLGWVFASFLQGVGGFGVPVAVTAPLLVGIGLAPLPAVIVPFIGHSWAVTYGSLGSSFIALTGATGQAPALLAPPTSILLGLAAPVCGALAAYAAAGLRGLWRALPPLLVIGAVMALVQYVMSVIDLWNIASACAGLAGLATGLLLTRGRRWRGSGNADTARSETGAVPAAGDRALRHPDRPRRRVDRRAAGEGRARPAAHLPADSAVADLGGLGDGGQRGGHPLAGARRVGAALQHAAVLPALPPAWLAGHRRSARGVDGRASPGPASGHRHSGDGGHGDGHAATPG